MMKNRSWDDWIAQYSQSHQNRWNQLTHSFGIPMIVLSLILALLSLSLAILNLLPIPLLDGGHLLYYLIELVKGSPVSERAMVAGQYVGLALLASLMGLAFYNDILQLVR